MSLLEIKNLHARINNQEILKGINLTVNAGEMHSIMGPNGSGKSTLAQVLARRESFEITQGEILFNGKDLLAMKPEEAACEGLFMAFQYPVEVPGISNAYFLRAALNAVRKYRGQEELRFPGEAPGTFPDTPRIVASTHLCEGSRVVAFLSVGYWVGGRLGKPGRPFYFTAIFSASSSAG